MQLDSHDAIAWDFDNTLVDCPTALSAQQYIANNPDKTHYIVTFRSHGMEDLVFDELMQYPVGLTIANFAGVINLPDDRFEQYEASRAKRLFSPSAPPSSAETYYRNWKGWVCSKLGIRVLVDDDTNNVSPGCERYGVQHIHPDELF